MEPIDYESVTVKNKTVLQNDPQRELLLFPHDDVSVSLTRVNRLINYKCRPICVLVGVRYDTAKLLASTKRVTHRFHACTQYSPHNVLINFSFLPRTIIDWNTLGSLSPLSVNSHSIETSSENCQQIKYKLPSCSLLLFSLSIINLNLKNYLYFQVAACRQATIYRKKNY